MSEDQVTVTTEAPPEFELRFSGDKLSLLVTMADPHQDLAASAARIAEELPSLELAAEVDADTIAELLAQACEPGQRLDNHPLLTGQMPEAPRDGEIQWQEDFFATGFARNEENDRLDYWQRAENRAVNAEQLLAVVLLPLEGKPGITLQGNEVPVPKPRPARLRAGKGVKATEQDDRILIHATVSGRITHKDGTVSVDDVYTVRGNVGLETGNITHTGALVVQGDVKEGARIECEGDVMIKGMVEPSNINCGGNLTVGGGIVGDRDHRIDVVGTVQARYLNDVVLRASGDVMVTSQIDHSEVETLGQVLVPKGRIAGGVIKAYKGVHVGHAGAAKAAGTVIMAGVDWRLIAKQRDRRTKMIQLQEIREELNRRIDRAVANGVFNDEHRAAIDDMALKVAKIDKALQAESEVFAGENEESAREAVREVVILIALWSGVTFQLGTAKVVSDRSYDLPRLVTLRRDKARILPMGEPDDSDPAATKTLDKKD